MSTKALILFFLAAAALLPGAAIASAKVETVELASPDSPLVAVRLLFRAGSAYDPQGKEGLAALTGLMVGQAGTQERSYGDLLDALYPMAASIRVNTDREVTLLAGEIHREKLDEFTSLLTEVILRPAFAESDLRRNREQLLTHLTNTLRASDDELLGLELLQQEIFAGHPYGHAPAGTVQGLNDITLEDVKGFYRRRFTRASLLVGVAGGYPEGYPAKLAKALSALPEGEAQPLELPAPPTVEGRHFTLIDKETASVGIHFGYPLPLTRADADYYPLMVANSFLGEHRSSYGRLFQELREKRGLNYGDYSYLEYWERPPTTDHPTPNVPRRQQYFSVWIRPVVPETAHFAVRAAIYELERLVENGMTQEEFDLTRTFLVNYSKLWAQTLSRRLGFLMDSHYYGTDYYIDKIDERLPQLRLQDVNRAIRKYLQTADSQVVLVAADAEALQNKLQKDEASPISYNSQVEAAVLESDKKIQKLPLKPTSIDIVPVEEVFQK